MRVGRPGILPGGGGWPGLLPRPAGGPVCLPDRVYPKGRVARCSAVGVLNRLLLNSFRKRMWDRIPSPFMGVEDRSGRHKGCG